MGQLLIVRHGETEWNTEGRVQGHTDVALSQRGEAQAQELSRRLRNVTIDAAYSSDLSRAAETARHILADRKVKLNLTPRLRERYHGVFEGLNVDERQTRYPEQFAASLVMDLDFAPEGGENVRQTSARMAPIMDEIKSKHLEETVLIVGHGGSLRAGLVTLMGLPIEANWRFVMHNCGLSIIDTYSDNAVMRLYNDTSHLSGLG